ncbi:MAG: tyrosine-type recombinase/integrase [Patescibacteria group bacterium]
MEIENLLTQFCDYSLHIRGYTPDTIKRYKFAIRFFWKHAQPVNVGAVTPTMVQDWFLWGRVQRHWSASGCVTYHKSLLVFFRWCVQRGYIKENPASDLELPKHEKRLPPKLTKQEALRILEAAYNYPYTYTHLRYRDHAIMAMFIYAGLRKTELIKLQYGDVDLENMSIFIRRGKGNKDRVVPICHNLAVTLHRYDKERRRLNKTCPQFFASLIRDMGITEISLRRIVLRVQKASKIKFGVHKLRHTFATLMLEGGCDIYSLSRMMGHSDIKTTTIYLAASAEHLRSQIMKHPLNEGM